ncbi:flagellar biosynthesis protein FlhA [Lentisphaerota bacterium WC36G]|nr:flagellar biosynthesis protein FlhA [Lentisphaerae bacterium WC36]
MLNNFKNKSFFSADVFFAFCIGIILFILIFPLPPAILSFMLVANISISVMLLMLIFYIKTPLEISSFPTLLLVLTLFRLSLNVASTKLILLDASAGSVIEAFGNFVVQGDYIVGAIIFLILVIINFLVIVKGSSRIAEVSARFTLDAMPGKQMSIDSDLNAGLIDEDQARKRRQELSDEAEFHGAMDGASKFVTGDAIAGIVITVINIVAGIAIGCMKKDNPMTVFQALETYGLLTIGDGLVSQIPALLISVSAGMLVAKTNSSKGATGTHLLSQLFARHEPIFICASMIIFLGCLPAFDFLTFVSFATILIIAGVVVMQRNKANGTDDLTPAYAGADGTGANQRNGNPNANGLPNDQNLALPSGATNQDTAKQISMPKLHPMTLEVGFSLVPMVDPNQDGDLVERISMIRKQICEELGFLIPPISIQDNLDLANNEYRLMIRGLERARSTVYPQSSLAINPGDAETDIDGIKTIDPAFNFPAVWISPNKTNEVESLGYTVVDPSTVITTHVTKLVKDYASNLLSRQDVSNMIEYVKESNPTVVEELVPNALSVGVIHRVLQLLLTEKVPIHDLSAIFETLSDYAAQTKEPVILAEFARQALKGHIIARYVEDNQMLYACTIDPVLENELQSSINEGRNGGMLNLTPQRALQISESIKEQFDNLQQIYDYDIVLLASPLIRHHLFKLLDRKIEDIAVISYSEVSDDVPLKILGSINVDTRQ